MKVAIVKYNAGNVQSVSFALQRLGLEPLITNEAEQLQQADRVIIPGVGEANTTMQHLKSSGLSHVILGLRQPVLGICLGMQIMCRYSEENNTECLGIFDEDVKQFRPSTTEKVPHMGWNQLLTTNGWINPNLMGQNVYFVHSFYVPLNSYTAAATEYGITFSAALQKNNFYGVQFHPEKSGKAGETVLQNFLAL